MKCLGFEDRAFRSQGEGLGIWAWVQDVEACSPAGQGLGATTILFLRRVYQQFSSRRWDFRFRKFRLQSVLVGSIGVRHSGLRVASGYL